MKISTKGRYGLRILLDLAVHENDAPRLIRDIARSQQLSEKYIGRLILELRNAGMVKSIRGAKGGYRLARPPQEISVLSIIEIMEGPVRLVDCVQNPTYCERSLQCAAHDIWMQLNAKIKESLAAVTLQDIIGRYHRRNADDGIFDFWI